MTRSGIEWTDRVWNPVTGCTKVSEGCRHCYAETWAGRQMGPWKGRRFEDVRLHHDRLDQPLRWRKPARVFVNSMSDLFHDDVPDEFLVRVFATMMLATKHTFLVLTKRPERMRVFCSTAPRLEDFIDALKHLAAAKPGLTLDGKGEAITEGRWVVPNVHLGVSVEDQQAADERIPILLDTPAAVRWISAEPLLGPVDVSPPPLRWSGNWLGPASQSRGMHDGLDWVVVGGESGPGARPCDVAWIRSIVSQCREARVPVFVKQLGAWAGLHATTSAGGRDYVDFYSRQGGFWMESLDGDDWLLRMKHRKGADPTEWPEDLRVQEFPA